MSRRSDVHVSLTPILTFPGQPPLISLPEACHDRLLEILPDFIPWPLDRTVARFSSGAALTLLKALRAKRTSDTRMTVS